MVLTLGWDGTLIVAGSSSSRRKYTVASLELRGGAHPNTEWTFTGHGEIALSPTYTVQAVTVPMVTPHGVQNLVVRRADLPKNHAGGVGSCL